MAYRLLHKKSSVPGKTPTETQLEYGELAINYSAESPQLHIKNSSNKIVNFIDEGKINNLLSAQTEDIEDKLEVIREALLNKQETLLSGTNIKTINNTSILGSGNINITTECDAPVYNEGTGIILNQTNNTISVDTNLVALKSELPIVNWTYERMLDAIEANGGDGELVPGQKYRITNYVTTTKQADTISANHQFDIIVEAIEPNKLNENAQACLHDFNGGDSYFEGNKLDVWEIKYCIKNDTSRFAWADTTNGKGVIYYMKDEFNNEAWYDFKNIQFLRTSQWFKDNPKFIFQFSDNKYFYTFSVVDGGVIKDDTLYTTKYHATDNHLGRNTAKITKLNNTIFIDKPNNGVFNNIIADGHGNNTFGQSIWNNTIGHNCLNNIISKSFQYNNISSNFKDNHCWGSFAYNEIEAGCVNNRFLGNVTKCTFKQAYALNNFTGETLSQCTFGMGITYISDMPSMTNVTFSNNSVSGSTSMYLNNLKTTTGNNLLSVIQGFNAKFDYTILLSDNDKYNVFSHNIISKISNIHDLGSFENSGGGEDAAKNPNIGTNANISLMKYYVPSLNKTGVIEQMVGPNETTQFITWDGLRKFRKLQYQNVGGNMSLMNNPSWEEIKFISSSEWTNRLSGCVTTSGNQTITGTKQFNNGINISGKSTISSSIDPGELKVFKSNDSTACFTIRTNGKFDTNIPKLELLGTNNSAAYKYQFPKLANPNDTDFVVVQSQLQEVINNYNTLQEKVRENEEIVTKTLINLNKRLEELEKYLGK
jgi:hypothetical protein